jgi:3-hydroxyisobutyrate dehydrogenase-like beta-hydroxyacid dehydrogenase
MPEQLGFIGLGNMGEPMAANLLAAGYGLRVYNRTTAKASPVTAKGALLAKSAADVALPAGIVLTMLSDDHAVEGVCMASGSFVEKLGPGGIHVSLSTISPAAARRLSEHHAKYKVEYVAAPVFGRPDAAAGKRLAVLLSGPAAAKKRVEPILPAISSSHFDFGEDAGSANVVKLCGNFLVASAIEGLAEALTLAEKNGVNKNDVADMLGKTIFACPVYQGYGKQIAEQRFDPPGFKLALGLKDINLALQTAASVSVPMPLASLLHDRWVSAVAKGRENLDWAAVSLGAREDAGLK